MSNYQLNQERGVAPEQSESPAIAVPEPVIEANPEISTSEVENTPVKQPEDGQNTPEKQPEQTEQRESQAEMNMRELRKNAKRYQRERDEAMARIKEMESIKNGPIEEEYDVNMADDDIAEGRHMKAVGKEMKNLKAKLAAQERQMAAAIAETRLKAECPDFDKVVCEENIETLKLTYPELAETIGQTPDIYKQARAAYTLIKKLGIAPDIYESDRAKVATNMAKPRPLASVNPQQGDSPLSKANAFANGLNDDMKKELWKDMQEAIKNR